MTDTHTGVGSLYHARLFWCRSRATLTTNHSGWNEPTGVVRPTRPCPQGARCSCWQTQSALCRGNARLSGVSIWLTDWAASCPSATHSEEEEEEEEEVCVCVCVCVCSTSRFHLLLFFLHDERLGKTSPRWVQLVTGDTLKHSPWCDARIHRGSMISVTGDKDKLFPLFLNSVRPPGVHQTFLENHNKAAFLVTN